ncbi:MAG: glycoside hydrolase family 43 protein [Phycisphaerae bacterium]|nr:glycoside hydrolase family 43 protein [Phycisphaerae bacterium]
MKAFQVIIMAMTGAWVTMGGAVTQAKDVVPGALWPDNHGVHINAHGGGMLVHDGLIYWFGEHKIQGRRGNTAQVGVHCYSSTDLAAWTDRGIALAVSEDPGSDIVKGCVIERPKVIYNAATKKFVMWFHLELRGQGYNAARTGVAVSDTVTGPYRFIHSLRPNAGTWPYDFPEAQKTGPATEEGLKGWTEPWLAAVKAGLFVRRDFKGGQMSRDMTLFVDDDGKAYHFHAAEENLTMHISELSDDYLSFTGKYACIFPAGHNEAPAVFKRKGKYYLLTSGCTGWAPNPARLAVADSIWGPWTALGNPCQGVNPENDLGPEKTFGGQSTYVLPVPGKSDAYIAMFDMWRPRDPIDGRYLWLPIEFTERGPSIRWKTAWNLNLFDQ